MYRDMRSNILFAVKCSYLDGLVYFYFINLTIVKQSLKATLNHMLKYKLDRSYYY